MNVDQIREYCMSFPGAAEKLQWGDALCFKTHRTKGKMFAVLGLDHVRFTFKCTPEKFLELIEREGIRPAPYVARYNWVMLDHLNVLPDSELKDLIRRSYEMVSAKGPGRKAKKTPNKKKTVKKNRSAGRR